MEFTRRAWNVSLPVQGGDAHTYDDGGRCDLAPFRRFEALRGEHTGIVEIRGEDGAWKESSAAQVGHRVLDGCAMLANLRYEVGGAPVESLSLLTWNTFAQSFEEDVLDSRPDSPLHVLYGQESQDAIELVRSGRRSPTAAAPRRHRWRLGEQRIELDVATSPDDGATWQQTLRVRLGSRSTAPGP